MSDRLTVFKCDCCGKSRGEPPEIVKVLRSDGSEVAEWWCYGCMFSRGDEETRTRLMNRMIERHDQDS